MHVQVHPVHQSPLLAAVCFLPLLSSPHSQAAEQVYAHIHTMQASIRPTSSYVSAMYGFHTASVTNAGQDK